MIAERMLALFVTCTFIGCQSSPAPQPKPTATTVQKPVLTQEQKFGLCDLEGFRAFNTARQYIVFKDSKENIRSYLGKSESAQLLAQELFARVDSKSLTNHAVFGAEKLLACANREGMQIGKGTEILQACYSRTDIAFFLATSKSTVPNKADAIKRVSDILKDRTLYPVKLISATADVVYQPGAVDTQKLMGTVFWSCVYNDEWKQTK
jgi:hypothetical protein